MIKGIQTVSKSDIDGSLISVLAPKFKMLLEIRGAGHCMKVSDLETELMYQLSEVVSGAVEYAQVAVLAITMTRSFSVTSTKLVELRNPNEHGQLRQPLLIFVPNELKTSSEDSFGAATFEQIDISDAYLLAFNQVKLESPDPIKRLLDEVYFILQEKAALKLTAYQWLRYALTIKVNGFDPSVAGAALYELGLIPDLELHKDHSMLVRKLVKNHECVQIINHSEKSAIATAYDLQLEGEDFNKRLALFLNDQENLLDCSWRKQLVVDSSNWPLTFDKWHFQYEEEATDAVCLTVTEVGLPIIPDGETDPNLQQLIGQQVLTTCQGGLKKFSVTFSVSPKPSEVNGLAKYKAQVFTQQGDFVGLIKVGKATSKSTVTITFNKLTGIEWEEGWHYIRVQAFDESDELLPLVDDKLCSIPWGTSSANEAGSRINESDLFYVLPAADAEIEPIEGRKVREASLSHAKIKSEFANVIETEKFSNAEVMETTWQDSKNKAESIVNVKFKKGSGFQIPVTTYLKNFEQKILASPMAALTWRVEIRNQEVSESSTDAVDWPIKGIENQFEKFKVARETYFQIIHQNEKELVSVAHDHVSSSHEANIYSSSYLEYLAAVFQETANGHDYSTELAALLRLDSLSIVIWNYDGSYKEVMLLGPTHPLRALWLGGWASLAEAWARQSEKVGKEVAVGTKNSLLEELSLTNFPYVLPDTQGQLMVALDSIHPFWSILSSAKEKEPQALIDKIKTVFGIKNDYQQVGKQNSAFLATKVERYLIQHPYVNCLSINVFNAGSAGAVAGMLLALRKKAELKHICFDIRLFVTDPYATEVGSDLFKLINSGEDSEIENQLFHSTENHLQPKLSISLRATSEFEQSPDEFQSHLSMLFDVFPAQELSVVKPQADEQVAPIYGLYQDYCIDYFDENGVVAWDRHTRHGAAKMLFGNQVSETIAKLPKLMSAIAASLATGDFSLEQVPVVRLALDSTERALLNQLHEVSDWVFTVDRNLGIEFFDHGGKDGRPDYLIDHSPEMASSNTHNFVITSRSTTEIEALMRGTLEQHQIVSDVDKATRVLDSLRALSGRLALKLASNSASKSEALGLALSKLYLEYQGVFKDQIIVPLDAHLELYSELQKADSELGSDISFKRTDLALFDLDASSRTIRCNLVEVKCYSDVGNMTKYESLKKSIAEQISESERIIQRHFDLKRTIPDRPDRLVKTQKLCVLLEHYLKRSERFGLLSSEIVEEAKFLLRTLEQGYKLSITRSAVIFDFGQNNSGVEKEVGIEFHRIGRNHIDELLSAKVPEDDEQSVGTLDSLELTLPKLTSAEFLHKERDRTVSWAELIFQAKIMLPERPCASEDDTVKVIPFSFDVPTTVSPSMSQNLEEAKPISNPVPVVAASAEPEPDENLHNPNISAGNKVEFVPHDIVLGVNGDSAQFGLLGEVHGRKIALDLNHTHTLSLFGVQGGGKSYTLGSVVEMATKSIPSINTLHKELASVIFHYSATQDYKPEFTSMIAPNDDVTQLAKLREVYGAEPTSLDDVVLLAPEDKLDERRAEYPGIEVHPLKFCSSELQAGHWKFLMGAIGNQAAYIRQLGNIMRKNRNNLSIQSIRDGIHNSSLSDSLKDLANMRLDFAEQYIDDQLNVGSLIRPGRMIVVDVRDEFIEKDEALGLFVVLLQIFSEAKYQGQSFNKLIVFDECHKYIDSPDLVKGLVETVREMRHKGTSVMIASQDPPSVPIELIQLSSQIILHKFNAPDWLKHIQKACIGLKSLTPEKLGALKPGEAYIWSSKANDNAFVSDAMKIQCRPRVTKHGGETLTAV
ncbi:methylation-associated defense system ATP-binding protein MAD8 [Enterobacter quasiroggenkampii]|uniref:methylation-associated defense system ATP-binding protein MAD8 n=1 Tax=Enterobacter quasiroggenkampii TaxID=2497436 RepID=UPI002075100B|nr:ATP-binding protein [Enterobacter quasiroggenkampii]MCM7168349.1 ATP-binding protein [Enterobacter quasiroggenkampii]